MDSNTQIEVRAAGEQPLNGMGMMILQYLEQNLADFEHKVEEGLRLQCCVTIEVDKGITTTVDFKGETIEVSNDAVPSPDLYLKSSYLLFANVLSGKANPVWETLRGKIKLKQLPKKPFQALRVLRFLKIPPELILETGEKRKRPYGKWVGVIIAIIIVLLVVASLLHIFW